MKKTYTTADRQIITIETMNGKVRLTQRLEAVPHVEEYDLDREGVSGLRARLINSQQEFAEDARFLSIFPDFSSPGIHPRLSAIDCERLVFLLDEAMVELGEK